MPSSERLPWVCLTNTTLMSPLSSCCSSCLSFLLLLISEITSTSFLLILYGFKFSRPLLSHFLPFFPLPIFCCLFVQLQYSNVKARRILFFICVTVSKVSNIFQDNLFDISCSLSL